MADEKISEVSAKTTIHDTDLIPLVDVEAAPDETKHITGANAKTAMRGTRYYVVPFADGNKVYDFGYLIETGGDYARAWLRLPADVTTVVKMSIYAVGQFAEDDKMRAEFYIAGGAEGEYYTQHIGSIADHPNTQAGIESGKMLRWEVTTAGVLALTGGDSVQVTAKYEDAGNGDMNTDATFRTVEIEYT